MRTWLFLAVIALSVCAANSKLFAEPWKLSLNSNLLMTLNSFSDNWIGGDAGSFSWTSQAEGIAEKAFTEKMTNRNKLKLAFGQTKNQDKTTKAWSVPGISTDLIDFESILRFTLNGFADPYVSVNLLSQFVDKRDSLLLRYVNPVDLKESVGAAKDLIKGGNTLWTTRLGATVHQLVDRDKLSVTGTALTRSTDVVNDGGAELVSELRMHNKPNSIQFVSTLKLYEALVSSQSKAANGVAANDDWRMPHVNWENVLTLSLAKYLMLNAYAQILYDKQLSNDVRLKETLSLGVTYTFSSFVEKK